VPRSRPSDNGRGPEDRVTIPIASDRHRRPVLRPALRERRPRHSSVLVVGCTVPLLPGMERREAEPTRRRRVGRWKARRRQMLASGADELATGRRRSSDRRRFRRHLRHKRITSARISLRSLRLCGFESGRVGDTGDPRSETTRTASKKPSASICVICGQPARVRGLGVLVVRSGSVEGKIWLAGGFDDPLEAEHALPQRHELEAGRALPLPGNHPVADEERFDPR